MLVSILIPVLNERATLPAVLSQAQAAPLPAGCTREILVIDGGSTDGTRVWLTSTTRPGITAILNAANGQPPSGKGLAIRTGLDHAHGDIILIQDADLEYDPADYVSLLEPIVTGQAAAVYGSRFLSRPRRGELGMTRSAWLANKILTAATNLLYSAHLTDEATAYKAFRADLPRSFPLRCRGFEFCPEVTARLLRRGVAIHEVPIRYRARTRAQGKKIRPRDAPLALLTLFLLRLAPRRR